ncbi:glycohydrolase toxin TNT-related protein [Agromyces sp. NPDC055520]
MTTVQLNPSQLALDAGSLGGLATRLRAAADSAESALSGTVYMAGDDESARVFAHGEGTAGQGYDEYSDLVIKNVRSAASFVEMLEAAVNNTGRTYDGVQLAGAGKDPGSSGIAELKPKFGTPTGSVPTSYGEGPQEGLGEFADFVLDKLREYGVALPCADSGKLSSASSAWTSLHSGLVPIASSVRGDLGSVSGFRLPQQTCIQTSRDKLASWIDEVAESADGMRDYVAQMQENVEQAWHEIRWFLAQMAIEIVAEIALGAVLGAISFGAGAIAMTAKILVTVGKWVLKIVDKCKDLARIMRAIGSTAARIGNRMKGLLADAVNDAVSAGAASFASTSIVNVIRTNSGSKFDEGYQAQNPWTAAGSSAIGGAAGTMAGGFVSAARRGPNFGNFDASPSFVGNVIGGGVDGAVSTAAGAALFGEEGSMEGGILLGALMGGGMHFLPGGGGTGQSNTPSGLSNGGSPGTPSVPTPGGGGAPAAVSPGGSGGTSVPSDGAPTPGSGGGGSNTSGGGSSVDVSSDAPTPGAGDAGTGGGDSGSSVDLGSDAPTPGSGDAGTGNGDGSNVDLPSTPDSSSVDAPGSDAPSSDGTATDASSPASSTDGSTTDATAADSSATDSPSSSSTDGSSPESSTTDASTPESSTTDASTPESSTTDASIADGSSSADGSSITDASSSDAPTTATGGAAGSATSPATVADVDASLSTLDGTVDGFIAAVDADAQPNTQSATSEADAGAGAVAATAPADAGTAPADAETAPADGEAAPEADATTDGSLDAEAVAASVVGGGAAAGVLAMQRPKLPTTAVNFSGKPAGANGATSGHGDANAHPAAPADGNAGATDGSAGTPQADPATPGDSGSDADAASASPSNPPTKLTLQQILDALKAINPNFEPLNPKSEFNNNCGNTSSNLNDALNGRPVTEAPTGTLTTPEMEARTGIPQTAMTPQQVIDSLVAQGEGSHCVVGVDRSSGAGHWFNAYFDGTTVWTLDAQNGTMTPFPPHEPNATNWDASIHPDNVAAVTPAPDSAAPGATPDAATPAVDGGESPKAGRVEAPARGDTADAWNPEMGDPVLSGADRGPGWQRVPDRVTHNPIDPNYGDVRAPGQSSRLDDAFAHPGATNISPEIAHLITDPGAEYGYDANGNALSRAEWEARYTDANGWAVYPGNDGGDLGSFVEYHDADSFIADYGDELDRMGGPWGSFLSFPNTPFEMRSLPPSNLSDPYSVYEMTGRLPAGVRIEVSAIAPAFGRDGGGMQVRILDAQGKPMTVDELLDNGIVRRTDVDGAAGMYTPDAAPDRNAPAPRGAAQPATPAPATGSQPTATPPSAAANPPAPNGFPRPAVTNEIVVPRDEGPTPRRPFAARTNLEANTLYRVEGRGDFYTDGDGRVTYVETTYGGIRKLNADLMRPQPNTTYVVHPAASTTHAGVNQDHVFRTDDDGRTVLAHTDHLTTGDADRSESVQSRVGDEGGSGYDGGHLFGNDYGGGGEYTNLVAMLAEINRGSGDTFYNLENRWRALLKADPTTKIVVDILPHYPDGSVVPDVVEVRWTENGVPFEKEFLNV